VPGWRERARREKTMKVALENECLKKKKKKKED
jgi:hypothetical protein